MRTALLLAVLGLAACRAAETKAEEPAPTTVTGRRVETAQHFPGTAEPARSPAPAISQAQPASGEIPVYPEASRRLKEQGTVELTFEVLQSGAVRSLGVSRSSGHARLDDAALVAARTWRFNPRTGGDSVEVFLHRVVFQLTD